jgi:thiamine biosynthesis protein ThiS
LAIPANAGPARTGLSEVTKYMDVTINGEERTFGVGATVETMLAGLGLDDRKVAVERNREIVPKSQYGTTALSDGDVLEIVHFIGGG